jgi:GNAT superfamily N-acetyltransferase
MSTPPSHELPDPPVATNLFDAGLLASVEEAGLNASAAPEQRWLDGWLLRACPVKAKRSRCIYPLAPGRLALADRLERAREVFCAAGLPLVLRLTPLVPAEATGSCLDDELGRLGLARIDDTRVMIHANLAGADLGETMPATADGLPGAAARNPAGVYVEPCDPAAYAELIGVLRGTPAPQRAAHARRLLNAPVRHVALTLRDADGGLLACGQYVREDRRVGLFDVFVPPPHRGQGWARRLCVTLLARARDDGARLAYLQVEADNTPARAIYHRLGFADGYAYHYRCDDPSAV